MGSCGLFLPQNGKEQQYGMSSRSRLISIGDYNASQEVRLSAYADIIVYEQESPSKNMLRASASAAILRRCQTAYLRTFAEIFNGHVTGEFSDRCDGLGMDRPQLNAMIKHVADGRAEAVIIKIIKDEGRLGRSAYVVEEIGRKVRAHGDRVFYADRLRNAMGRTMYNHMCGSQCLY